MRSLIFFVTMLTFPVVIQRETTKSQLRIWKTPQGQMITWIRDHECLHLDVGGSPANWVDILKICHGKKHVMLLSHQDREHLKLINRFKHVGATLLTSHPDVETWIPKKTVQPPGRKAPLSKSETENQKSRIFFLKQPKVLITGDSPIKQEREFLDWARRKQPKLLVLGNHGRARSTSRELLAALPSLRWTWASSMPNNRSTKLQAFIYSGRVPRRNRIDLKTKKNLQSHGLPVLGTHDWGTISLH